MTARYDDEWGTAATDYIDADRHLKAAKEAMDVARDNLLALTEENASGFGVSVKFTERKGSVDYAGIVQSHLPELNVEMFRKPSVSTTTINVSKEV